MSNPEISYVLPYTLMGASSGLLCSMAFQDPLYVFIGGTIGFASGKIRNNNATLKNETKIITRKPDGSEETRIETTTPSTALEKMAKFGIIYTIAPPLLGLTALIVALGAIRH